MKIVKDIDSRIANYLLRKLNNYVQLKKSKQKETARLIWEKRFGESDSVLHNLSSELKIRLYKDSVLSKFIFDGFEMDEIDFLNHFLSEGDCFVDIGANVGLFSLYAGKKVGSEGKVISFEPSQITYKRLLENISLNNLTNVRPYKLGLSDAENLLTLNISENGYDAWNTFVQSRDKIYSRTEQVQVKTLDGFFEEISMDADNITLIKLDVEGFELNVLNGAKKLLSREHAPVFLVEFTDANANAAGHCCHEIYKFLNNYGYTWYRYDSSQKKLIYDPLRVNYPYTNLIAIKNPSVFRGLARFTFQNVVEKA